MSKEGFELTEHNTWQVVAKDSDNEPHVFDLEGKKYKKTVDVEELLIRQAPPLRITPSRTRIPEREHRVIVDLPDIQMDFYHDLEGERHPTHDERALKVARMICQDLKPNVIVIGGDNVDMAALSRFEKDSLRFSAPEALQLAIDGLSNFLGHLRSENPQSRIIMLEGNHDKRLSKYVLKHAEKLYGLKRANSRNEYPVNTFPFLLRLEDMKIEYASGYPANEVWLEDDLVFVHGDRVRSSSSTAELYSKDYDNDVIFHHIHRHEMHSRTTKTGRFITAASFGTLASIEGDVPSYGNGIDDRGNVVPKYENWQQGMGVILQYPDGYREMHPIHIRNGQARFLGREYRVR